jgi:bis(5'-nucleosyl)-tetraphosphatase (symmetrical)
VTVLGNHDLHLLAVAAGCAALHDSDTLDDILAAPDRDELLQWLRQRPLLHHDADLNVTLIHAGLAPQWDLDEARSFAGEVEAVLRGDDYRDFFQHMYGDQPDVWQAELSGWERWRFIINSFTRLRYCDANGRYQFKAKGEPGTQPEGYMPWFAVPGRRSRAARIVFGHWSSLGLHQDDNVIALDTGCLWGEQLTAVRLDGAHGIYCVECPGYRKPAKKTGNSS